MTEAGCTEFCKGLSGILNFNYSDILTEGSFIDTDHGEILFHNYCGASFGDHIRDILVGINIGTLHTYKNCLRGSFSGVEYHLFHSGSGRVSL